MTTDAVAYFCPQCGSPSLSWENELTMSLDTAICACTSCSWRGQRRQLMATPFAHEFFDNESVLFSAVRELRGILARTAATPMAAFLVKWGFMQLPPNPKVLARYFAAMERGVFRALVEERRALEEEQVRARN